MAGNVPWVARLQTTLEEVYDRFQNGTNDERREKAMEFWSTWVDLSRDDKSHFERHITAENQRRFRELMRNQQFLEFRDDLGYGAPAMNNGARRGNAVAYEAPAPRANGGPANQPRLNRQGGGKRRRKSKTRRSTKRRTTRKH